MGRWCGRALRCGDALLLQGLFLLIPGAALRGGLVESKAHGDGNFRRHQQEKDETLSPEIAPTFFVAQFVQMGKRLGRFGAFVVRIINDEAATGETVVA